MMGARGDEQSELKRLAHEVRNALNGVAVNLEVARTRAARGIAPEQLTPFLEAAAQQLDAAARFHKQYTDIAAAMGGDERSRPDEVASHSRVNP